MSIKQCFFDLCNQHFDYLSRDYGFSRRAAKTVGGTYSVTYQNRTTALEVLLEWHEQLVVVLLCRLVDGEIIEKPVIIRPESPLHCFSLENLLLIKDPARLVTPDAVSPLSREDLDKILANYSEAVRLYAADILRGDFHEFAQLERMVKQRALQHSSEGDSNPRQRIAA